MCFGRYIAARNRRLLKQRYFINRVVGGDAKRIQQINLPVGRAQPAEFVTLSVTGYRCQHEERRRCGICAIVSVAVQNNKTVILIVVRFVYLPATCCQSSGVISDESISGAYSWMVNPASPGGEFRHQRQLTLKVSGRTGIYPLSEALHTDSTRRYRQRK